MNHVKLFSDNILRTESLWIQIQQFYHSSGFDSNFYRFSKTNISLSYFVTTKEEQNMYNYVQFAAFYIPG